MSKELVVVARIEAKEDKVEFVKSELIKLIEPTHKERGCIRYDLHQDNENPALFLFFEEWESRELWQAHIESRHLKAYINTTEASLESFYVHEMSKVEV